MQHQDILNKSVFLPIYFSSVARVSFSGATQRGLIVIDQVTDSSTDSEILCLSSLLFAK